MEKATQLLVAGRVVCSIHRSVVLAEELLALSFGKLPQDHQWIGWVLRRPCGHLPKLRSAVRLGLP